MDGNRHIISDIMETRKNTPQAYRVSRVFVGMDRSAAEALAQDAKGYAAKYATGGRSVTKVGINFSSAERNITEWQAVQA